MSRKKTTDCNTVFFPLFEQCNKYTLDTYWKKVFSDCSRNRFPVGMSYDSSNNDLFVRDNGKTIRHPLSGLGETDIFRQMMAIFKGMGIHSTREIKNYIDDLEKEEDIPDSWAKVKPKKAREGLLLNFIRRKSTELGLSKQETRRLTSVILVGLQLGEIKGSNIHINGDIEDIDCVKIEKGDICIKPQISGKKGKQTNKTTNTSRLYPCIDKFVKDFTAPKSNEDPKSD